MREINDGMPGATQVSPPSAEANTEPLPETTTNFPAALRPTSPFITGRADFRQDWPLSELISRPIEVAAYHCSGVSSKPLTEAFSSGAAGAGMDDAASLPVSNLLSGCHSSSPGFS